MYVYIHCSYECAYVCMPFSEVRQMTGKMLSNFFVVAFNLMCCHATFPVHLCVTEFPSEKQ